MRNKVNMRLVAERDIGPVRHYNLNCLHFIMNCVMDSANVLLSKGYEKEFEREWLDEYREAVHHLEFLMQDEWGFERNKEKHTHIRSLEALIGSNGGITWHE